MKKYILFTLLSLGLLTSSCNDSCDNVDYEPYIGPTGGQHHKMSGADEDYCDC